ncbi:DUF6745 domain-containing protein [Yinghuangia seranimata]|uniref:DUF6745 domain-containing protein n=1 Tax=Yinghuangia seranimata TaxID=408067 RepID=UPI00248B0FFC|nr:hypothetical protein [Yinghuangia seranimata]MDI2131565.1 hypothetical protein [Yinghuangia seranimata]
MTAATAAFPELTLAHRAALSETADTWAAVAAATGPADRAAAEAAIRDAYRAAGLAEPDKILWYDSPLAAAVAATVVSGAFKPQELAAMKLPVRAPAGSRAGAPVRDRLRAATWERARTDAAATLGQATWAQAWQEVAERLWAPTTGLTARIREGVEGAVSAATGGGGGPRNPGMERTAPTKAAVEARAATLDAMGGQHDAAWLAAFDGLRRCFPELAHSPAAPALDAVGRVARAAGWWWPYERVVLVAERPTQLHRDENARLHSGEGAALAFPDGFALHAWRGMPIPADFVTGLGPRGSSLDATRIRNEDNAELRRVMLEIYGYDRYLSEVGAQPLHRDATGVLWRIQLPGDEPVVMVEVLNSTPEPDGSVRTYWLRVPPTTRTARAGVAWTFGLTEEEYHPSRET